MSGAVVPSVLLANGSLQITVSDTVKAADQYAWVFKISYGGLERGEVIGGNGSSTSPVSSSGADRSAEWAGSVLALTLFAVTMVLI